MATDRLHVPHDHRMTLAAMAALITLAALVIFLMLSLIRNVGAY